VDMYAGSVGLVEDIEGEASVGDARTSAVGTDMGFMDCAN
jgi:hypothetical protein